MNKKYACVIQRLFAKAKQAILVPISLIYRTMYEIRPADISDTQAMLDIYAPVIEKSATSFEFTVPDIEEFQARVSKIRQHFPWLVCTDGHHLSGYAYAGPHRSREAYQWSTELSVYVSHRFHRKGIARALYSALTGILKLQGFYTALAGITLPNDTSVAFHESFGFKWLGTYHNVGYKFGQWHAVGWWEYPLLSYQIAPVPTKSVKEIEETREWHRIISSAVNMITNV